LALIVVPLTIVIVANNSPAVAAALLLITPLQISAELAGTKAAITTLPLFALDAIVMEPLVILFINWRGILNIVRPP
jgi:hypothetical protein